VNFVSDPSLVLYLPLYQPDGSSFMSGDAYGHSCAVTGALWRPNGRSFDGTDDLIEIPDHTALRADQSTYTMEIWLKGSGAGIYNSKDSLGVAGTQGYDLNIFGGKLRITIVNISHILSSCTPVSSTVMQHWVVTRNSDNLLGIYLNSQLDNATTSSFSGNTGNKHIGKSRYGQFNGIIGEFRMYNRALTAGEIQHNYLATKWRYA